MSGCRAPAYIGHHSPAYCMALVAIIIIITIKYDKRE